MLPQDQRKSDKNYVYNSIIIIFGVILELVETVLSSKRYEKKAFIFVQKIRDGDVVKRKDSLI